MAVKKKKQSLSRGRPPLTKTTIVKPMSSKASRTIINTHHRLHKDLTAAKKKGDETEIKRIEKQIEANGGLKKYQVASIQGQAADRGGDSSKLLVEWLQQSNILMSPDAAKTLEEPSQDIFPIRVLEIGALSTQNEISKQSRTMEVVRIDLNSQSPGIQQQDFMERPLPKGRNEEFDLISLSLVLNYVPDPNQRGEMLKRLCSFLRVQSSPSDILPSLFFVLPRPCVTNSRYLDENLLEQIMASLGFAVIRKKLTHKLCYYLFHWNGKPAGEHDRKFSKKLVRQGPGMNNFCIVVK
jgi:25S rRNA (adenine2142-N1)-methyltransferase